MFRRFFGNEINREIQESVDLNQEVIRLCKQAGWDGKRDPYLDFQFIFYQKIQEECQEPLRKALFNLIGDILDDEPAFEVPQLYDWESLSLREAKKARDTLRLQKYFYQNRESCLEKIRNDFFVLIDHCNENLPTLRTGQALFTISLVHLFAEPRVTISAPALLFFDEWYQTRHFFERPRDILLDHFCVVSKQDRADMKPEKFTPIGSRDVPLSDEIRDYLFGTHFYDFFSEPIPLHVPQETFFGHTHVIGGTGAGKTQWLSQLILHHINDPSRPSVVVVDSQGDLIGKLWRMREIRDRSILISPKDVENPLAINVFDLKRLGTYNQTDREQVVAGAIDTLDYLFSGIVGAELTAKQSVFFRLVSRLLITLPQTLGRNATLLDVLNILDDLAPYEAAVAALPMIHRKFFEKDFKDATFKQTKEQIRYRLNGIFENPTLERMFTAPETKLDIFAELNKGSIILVDTAKDFLKSASPHFGRILISLVLQAVLERAVIAENKRHPAHLVVDEAAEYFDRNIDGFLTQARKYRLGCTFAHQYLDQCTPALKSSFAANTAIKMAAGVSTHDARILAPDLHTTPDFITGQPRLHFATYIRSVTPSAVSVPVVAGLLDEEEHMSSSEEQEYLRRNRDRITFVNKPCDVSEHEHDLTSAKENAQPSTKIGKNDPDSPDISVGDTW